MENIVIEDSMVFLLMAGKSIYSVIPKRAFKGEDQVNRFRELIQTAVPKHNKQRF